MLTARKVGMLVALPVAVATLTGAGSNPALAFHGVFDSYTRSANCRLPDPAGHMLSGVWNVNIPDPGRPTAGAELVIKLDGGMVVHGNVKLQLAPGATSSSFSATTDPTPPDPITDPVLSFSLSDQVLVYSVRHEASPSIDDPIPECLVQFYGHPTN
jgi:hypothetical protein